MELEEVLLDRKPGEIGPDLWFDLVFDDTKDALLRYVYVHLDNPAAAEDVLQDVYANLYRRISRRGTRDIKEPAAFVMQMAKREISRCNRRECRRRTVIADEPAEMAEVPFPSFEDGVAAREELRVVRETVRSLPPLTYKVFILYYFFDMAIADIAAELGSTTDAVKSRLSRARNAVRSRLTEA